jgi:GNAT superfamily N-acetyltransferase
MAEDGRPIVEVRDLKPQEIPAAVAVLARGMRDNPLHVAVYGPDPERRVRCIGRTFKGVFRVFKAQTPLCALDGETIVGATGIAPAGTCQPTFRQQIGLLPVMIAMGPRTAPRVGKWLKAWADRDPAEPHSHLGPLAVDGHLQGRGIGSQILAEYCRRLDDSDTVGYLETDKKENVPLYSRYGFDLVEEADVIGVPNWFMRRPPRPPAPPTGASINRADTEETAH